MSADEPVLLQAVEGGVMTVTLNRPHRKNAFNAALWSALRGAISKASNDSVVRALVLTGAGGSFSTGMDLSQSAGAHPLWGMREVNEIAFALHELPIPTIAKVTGVAVGAGWNLALGCDLVVATPQARFSQIFTRRGLSVDFGGSWLLPKLVGLQQAKRLVMLSEMIDAAEASRLGLVTWVVDDAEIDGFTNDLARRLAAAPPVAIAQSKALLNEGAARTLHDALAGEARAQAVNFATADLHAAVAAYATRSEPDFTGRWAAAT